MANEKNQKTFNNLKDNLTNVESFYLVDYQGLTAGELSNLRKQIREKGGQLIVAKNTLIHLALKENGHDFEDILKGPSALVLASEDPAGVAKALDDVASGNDKKIPEVKAGYVEGSRVDVAVVQRLAKLGSKESLQAELVGVLSSHLSHFLAILDAHKTKKEEEAA